MTSSRPYLIRALYEWIVDNDAIPHLIVNADMPGTVVPRQHVRDGQIILNVSPSAVQALQMGNEIISFQARFGGQPMQVTLPVEAVLAIYDRDGGRGMMFEEEPEAPSAEGEGPEDEPPTPPSGGGKPKLRVVK